MKKLALLFLLGTMAATAGAQRMKIYRGHVCVNVPAAAAGEMTFTEGGTRLNVMGAAYDLSEVDSITIDRGEVAEAAVGIRYAGTEAFVEMSADVAPQLTVSIDGAHVGITADPTLETEVAYHLSGTATDGSFFMDGEYKAGIELDGLTLASSRGAAIDIANGKRIDIVLTDGTTTTLTDCTGGGQKACFFVNGHAEFKGGGTLLLTGNTKHAFASDEYTQLKASTGTIRVLRAVTDGFHVEQYFQMDGGTLDIAGTGSDCIDVSMTKDDTDEMNGEVFINGGSITMDVAADDTKGLKAERDIAIAGGTIRATVTGDGCKGIKTDSNLLVKQADPAIPVLIEMTISGKTYMPDDPELESKCRAIKTDGNFTFDGGTIIVHNEGTGERDVDVDGIYNYISGEYNFTLKN